MSGNHASKAMKMQVMTYLKAHPESTANMIYGSGEFKCSSSHIKKVLRILSDEGKVQTVGPNKRNRMFVLSEQDSEPTDEPQNVAISKAKLQSRGEADNSDYFRKVKIWFAINIKLNGPLTFDKLHQIVGHSVAKYSETYCRDTCSVLQEEGVIEIADQDIISFIRLPEGWDFSEIDGFKPKRGFKRVRKEQVIIEDDNETDLIQTQLELGDEPQVENRGRPPKDPEELRSERISVALTRSELAALQDICLATGVPVSEIVHRLIVKVIDTQDMDQVRAVAEIRRSSVLELNLDFDGVGL